MGWEGLKRSALNFWFHSSQVPIRELTLQIRNLVHSVLQLGKTPLPPAGSQWMPCQKQWTNFHQARATKRIESAGMSCSGWIRERRLGRKYVHRNEKTVLPVCSVLWPEEFKKGIVIEFYAILGLELLLISNFRVALDYELLNERSYFYW